MAASVNDSMRRVRVLLRRNQAVELWRGDRMLSQITVWGLPRGRARVMQHYDVADDVQVRVVDHPAPEIVAGKGVARSG